MSMDDMDLFDADIKALVEELEKAFKSTKARWFLHEQSDTLYIEIAGLETMSDSSIERIASPILEETDLDFEEIILLPLSE